MSGALTQSMARGWAGGGRARRRYADGGAAGGDPQPDDDAYSGLPPPAMPPTAPARQGALALANPDSLPPQPPGALGQMAPQNGGPPDQQDPDAQRKMFDLNRAMMVLQASRAGVGNNPLLAAAGAMLAPTRTGGFSESLGNAFTAYGKAGEQERATDEQMAERLLQAQWQNDYRQSMVGINQQKANTGSAIADARIPLMQAQSGMDAAHAALFEAKAALGNSSHKTTGDLQGTAIQSLMSDPNGNPDTGKPWTYADAFRQTQSALAPVQGAQIRAGTAADRMAQLQPLIDARVEAIQNTADYRNQLLALKATGQSDANAKVILDHQIRQQQTDILQQRANDQGAIGHQNADTNTQNATTNAAKVDQNQPLVDAKVQAIQATQEYHDAIVQMRKDGIAFTQASAAANLAAKIQAASPGTPWPKALAQAKAGLPGQSSMPPASSGAPAAATQPAPAATTPAPAATTPQTPPAGYPNARWSGKYGAFLIPGSAPGKWKVVGGAGGDVAP